MKTGEGLEQKLFLEINCSLFMDQVEEIKNRLNIIDIVKDYIKLEKAGANHRALCPFHSDKKPSLFVSSSKQIWKCFGCGAGGDIYEFIKKIEGVEFAEALEILAQKAGVELKRVSPEAISRKKRLYDLCDLTGKFFQKQLTHSHAGKKAHKYLIEKRGISEESIDIWRLGYAPDKWRSLSRFLTSRGFTREEIRRTGLAVLNNKGNFYDRFRGRIMFPIFDLHGRIIGFGGRVFKRMGEEKTAKYVNTSNTPLYNKSRVLYGLDKAKMAVRQNNACIVVEGYTDVILSHQTGIENVVASSGTALTDYQLRILKRYTNRLQFSFDMDSAGGAATRRGIALAQRKGFDIEVLLMPGSHDPADVIKDDPGEWKKIIEDAKEILEYYFDTTFSEFDPDEPQEKKKIAEVLLPVIKRVPNEIVRFHWIQKLAERLKVTEYSVERELKKIKLKEASGPDKNPEEQGEESEEEERTREEMMEDQLLYFFIQDPEAINVLKEEDMEFFTPEGVELFTTLKKNDFDLEQLQKELSPSLFQKLQIALLEKEVRGEMEEVSEEVKKCVAAVKNLRRKKELRALSERLKQAEKQGDEPKVKLLTEEFNKLSKQIENING